MSRAQFHDLPELLAPDDQDVQSRIVQFLDAVQFKPPKFIDDIDTPNSYDGSEGLILVSTGSDLVFASIDIDADNIVYGCKYTLENQFLSHATPLIPVINNQVYDSDNYYQAISNKFVIPTGLAGTYVILLRVIVETIIDEVNPTSGYVDLWLYVNGVTFAEIRYTPYILDNIFPTKDYLFCSPAQHAIEKFNEGDQIYAKIAQYNTPGAVNASADFEFTMARIGVNP